MAIKIEHRIGIAAPAEVIWEILADVPGWPAWNPIYPKAAGEVRYGGQLALTVALPGQAHREIEAPIMDWTPNEAIQWRLKAMGGFLQTIRYLEIEAYSESGCVFSNGEIYAGMAGPHVARFQRRSLKRGFSALGDALKDRAESVWRERQAQAG